MKKAILTGSTGLLAGAISSLAFGSGGDGIPQFINYYDLMVHGLGLSTAYAPVVASLFTLVLCTVLGLIYKGSVERVLAAGELAPSQRPSLGMLVEMAMDFVYSLAKEHGGHHYRRFLPLLAGLFVFILVANLSGLVPGLPPTTESFNTNLAMGLIVFLAYNYAGLKEHGAAYIKQFTGPFLILAPLFLGIELISHAVRPLSLAFRLLANIFCDHLLLGVFTGLVPLLIPVAFLFFGLLVAIIQSFVFALLTGIYINMAISHDH